MIKGAVIGHVIRPGMDKYDVELAHYVIPKDIDNPVILVSSVWSDKLNVGEVCRRAIKTRSWWDIEKNPMEVLKEITNRKALFKEHYEAVKANGGDNG